VKRLAQKRKTRKHDERRRWPCSAGGRREQSRNKAVGAELAGTGGGRPRRRLRAGKHWCRAQARAVVDLLGQREQPRTKVVAVELAGTPAADLGDGRGRGRTAAVLGRDRRWTCSGGVSSHAPRRRARPAAAADDAKTDDEFQPKLI
jgi:hypothetical protein